MVSFYKLKNSIKNYPWGDPCFIPDLLGLTDEGGKPFAELWMGAHSESPSLSGGVSLDQLIAGDRSFFLGPAAAKKDKELPFLFKVLSAAEALSVQVHPDIKLAEEGYARENRLGIPLNDFRRNYKDRNHKPEMLYALTPFVLLSGFRPEEKIEIFFFPWITLRREEGRSFTESFLRQLLSLDNEMKEVLLRRITEHLELKENRTEEEAWILKLNSQFPGDIGILAPWFLNLITLNEGEAIFLPALELHAYLKGSGLELMACSDNVLRCALTKKHIDKEDLLKIVRFHSWKPDIINPVQEGPGIVYPVPVKDFLLRRYTLKNERLRFPGKISPRILFSLDACLSLTTEKGESEELKRGESCFIPFGADCVSAEGEGTFFEVSAPEFSQ